LVIGDKGEEEEFEQKIAKEAKVENEEEERPRNTRLREDATAGRRG
jgi:hypothetical protein